MKLNYLLLLVLLKLSLYAQPISLDTSYGEQGFSYVGVGGPCAFLLPNQKMLIGRSNDDIGVTRLNTNGTIDSTFGVKGTVIVDAGLKRPDYIYSMTVQADNKILVVGKAVTEGVWLPYHHAILLARFTENGIVDSTFGRNGIVRTELGADDVRGNKIAVNNNGAIIVTGYTTLNNQQDGIVIKYKSNGMIDSTFGTNGLFKLSIAGNDLLDDFIIMSDNTLFISGLATNAANNTDMLLIKVNPNGTLNTNFGVSGIVQTDFEAGRDDVTKIVMKPNNKILLIGTSVVNTLNSRIAFAQYNSDGLLDISFSNDGKNLVSGFIPDHHSIGAHTVAMLPNNKILVCGSTTININSTNNYNFSLKCFNEDTNLNTAFGNSGNYTLVTTQRSELAKGLFVLNDGKIIVTTNNNDGGNGYGIAHRFQNAYTVVGLKEDNKAPFNIYPNPARNELHIEITEPIHRIEAFDVSGRLVATSTHQKNLAIEFLNKGIYLIKIYCLNASFITKFVKE